MTSADFSSSPIYLLGWADFSWIAWAAAQLISYYSEYYSICHNPPYVRIVPLGDRRVELKQFPIYAWELPSPSRWSSIWFKCAWLANSLASHRCWRSKPRCHSLLIHILPLGGVRTHRFLLILFIMQCVFFRLPFQSLLIIKVDCIPRHFLNIACISHHTVVDRDICIIHRHLPRWDLVFLTQILSIQLYWAIIIFFHSCDRSISVFLWRL